jgi:MFS superfamily sulfate permease-like transporter
LILFALEVTFPLSSRHVTFTTLFSIEHLPLLAASVLPALLICTVGEVEALGKHLNGFPSHPLYVPICCFTIIVTFWAVVAAGGSIDLQALASSGWLFMTKSDHLSTPSSVSWNYWALFNLSKVEWGALPAIAGDMSLLVFIGVLTLPIFASATAIHLEAFDHSMHREFVWHGIMNIFIGLVGGLPATLVR